MIVLSGGCSSNWHLKQSQKQLERAIKKGYTVKVDSIYIFDTIFIDRVKFDTSFIALYDTIEIQKDRLRIKYINREDTIFLEGECLPDTVVNERLIQVKTDPIFIKQTPVEWLFEKLGINTFWEKFAVGALFTLLIIILLAILIGRIMK